MVVTLTSCAVLTPDDLAPEARRGRFGQSVGHVISGTGPAVVRQRGEQLYWEVPLVASTKSKRWHLIKIYPSIKVA